VTFCNLIDIDQPFQDSNVTSSLTCGKHSDLSQIEFDKLQFETFRGRELTKEIEARLRAECRDKS